MKLLTSLPEYESAVQVLKPDDYQQRLEGVALIDISLDEVRADIERRFVDDAEVLHLKLETLPLKADGIEGLRPALLVEYRITGLAGKKQAIKIHAGFRVTLSTRESLPAEFLVIYGAHSLEMQVWPYLRELVDGLTSRMGAPRLTLPLRKAVR